MDAIVISDLEVFAHHGVFPEENVLGQKFLVSLRLEVDLRPAGQRDDLSASVNYRVPPRGWLPPRPCFQADRGGGRGLGIGNSCGIPDG